MKNVEMILNMTVKEFQTDYSYDIAAVKSLDPNSLMGLSFKPEELGCALFQCNKCPKKEVLGTTCADELLKWLIEDVTINFSNYQTKALRTAKGLLKEELILNGVLGLAGESGECVDIMKKHMFQGHDLDTDKLKDELGDVLWYLAITAKGLGLDLSEIANHNIEKLMRRYPDGFESQKSINRE